MVKVTSLIVKAGSGLRFSLGVRAWTEMEIRCVKGMHRLKLVSCEDNSGFKGLIKEKQLSDVRKRAQTPRVRDQSSLRLINQTSGSPCIVKF